MGIDFIDVSGMDIDVGSLRDRFPEESAHMYEDPGEFSGFQHGVRLVLWFYAECRDSSGGGEDTGSGEFHLSTEARSFMREVFMYCLNYAPVLLDPGFVLRKREECPEGSGAILPPRGEVPGSVPHGPAVRAGTGEPFR